MEYIKKLYDVCHGSKKQPIKKSPDTFKQNQ